MESISYCATEILIEIQRAIKILKWKSREITQYYFHIYAINQTTWKIEDRFKNKYVSFPKRIHIFVVLQNDNVGSGFI